MKKILLFLAVCALCFSLTSCGGLESRAKKQMRETMEELAKAPDDMKIIKQKTIINNDSLCVIHFIFKGKNGFGGWNSSRIEYVYVRIEDEVSGGYKYKESVIELNDLDSNSVLYEIMDGENKDKIIYKESVKQCIYGGRDVQE